jgi:hypothetical protein
LLASQKENAAPLTRQTALKKSTATGLTVPLGKSLGLAPVGKGATISNGKQSTQTNSVNLAISNATRALSTVNGNKENAENEKVSKSATVLEKVIIVALARSLYRTFFKPNPNNLRC